MKKVLITGATGFLGGALARQLAKDGYHVLALARRPERDRYIKGIENIDVVEGNILDAERMMQVTAGCSIVYHLAAALDGKLDHQMRVNVEGTKNVVTAAGENGVDRIVFASTISVYGYRNHADAFIQAAGAEGFRLILVLNQSIDAESLYAMPQYVEAQIRFIAERYVNEPAIIAYDLRNRPDEDARQFRVILTDDVLAWIEQATPIIHSATPNHYVTVSFDDASIEPLVDFLSFHHYGDVDSLRQTISLFNASATKPVIISELGYETYSGDEINQRLAYQRGFNAAKQNDLAGWVIWTAFDYPLPKLCPIGEEDNCEMVVNEESRFGLWNTSYFPKRALEAVRIATGADENK